MDNMDVSYISGINGEMIAIEEANFELVQDMLLFSAKCEIKIEELHKHIILKGLNIRKIESWFSAIESINNKKLIH